MVTQFYTNSCLQKGIVIDVNELKRIEVMATMEGGLIEAFMDKVKENRYLVLSWKMCTQSEIGTPSGRTCQTG
jgi:hypothetical protein